MFDLLSQAMQPAVLPVSEGTPDVVYMAGSNAPNPPPKLDVVYMTGSAAPNPPTPK